MVRKSFALGGAHLATLLVAVGCIGACSGGSGSGEDGTAGSAGDGGSGGSGGEAGAAGSGGGVSGPTDPEEPGARPPADPGMPAATGTSPVTFAMTALYLGDADRDFVGSDDAWKEFGYNLDGILSTVEGNNHCAPVGGLDPAKVKTDGNDGIDNSFAVNVVPLVRPLFMAPPSELMTESLTNGEFSLLLHYENVGADADQTGVDAALLGGAPFDPAQPDCFLSMPMTCTLPTFDGTDAWPIQNESLNGGNLQDPKVTFPDSFVAGGVWSSGPLDQLVLTIALADFELSLNVRNAVMAVELDLAASPATGKNGVIAGVLDTEELVASFERVAGLIEPSLCGSGTLDNILKQVRAASDIMADGTNGNPADTCNGVSVGFGFELTEVQLGPVNDPVDPAPDPCG